MDEFETKPDFPEGCAIIFGGTGGLGQSCARLISARGSAVVVTYRTRKEEANAVVSQIEDHGGQAIAVYADVTDSQSCKAAVDAALERFNRIHTVISAGGLAFETPHLADTSPETFRNVIETDVFGFFNIAQATLPAVREGGGGSYVALITTAVHSTLPGDILSAAPKASVKILADQIALEEAGNGIRANTIGPGVIGDAGMVIPMYDMGAKELLDNAVAITPLKRSGLAIEVSETVTFLASRRASYITGQMIKVDGGLKT